MQNYDVSIHKNDDNDVFDENELLRHVPESQKAKARVLIQFCNEYPEQITWNHDGVIFIDQVSIPNSNIFKIFHCLFGKPCASSSSDLKTGLDELLYKIKSIHLDYLISFKAGKGLSVPSSSKLEKTASSAKSSQKDELPDLSSDDSSNDLPWWFLG